MRGGRTYPGKPAPDSGGSSYLPPGGGMGPMYAQDPETSGPGKSIKTQHMGTVVGKRGAGNSQITGGDQMSHAMNHYGKKGMPGLNPLRGMMGGNFDGM